MLPRLTPKQRQRANALIKRLCANYDNGNCLALDDGEPCACVQSISYSLLCKYFRKAVLPAEPLLEGVVSPPPLLKWCVSRRPPPSKGAPKKNFARGVPKELTKLSRQSTQEENGQSRKIGAEKASNIKTFQLPHFEG